MRALTSLAGHILGSHPQINGYYEMHISYNDTQSLRKQLELYRQDDDLKANSHYLFDKLLHNDYALRLDRLNITNTKILVSLREPEQTIKSIVNLFAKKSANDLYAMPTEATKYYIDRLAWLTDFCRNVNHEYYYFDAETLQNAPEVLLPRLSAWLDLDSPLNEHYVLFSQTGKDRKGDTSWNIRSGTINKTQHDYSNIRIPEEQLSMAQQVYRECRQQIIGGAAESVTK